MKKKYLEKNGEFFGNIGDQIDNTEYRVGDIVSYAKTFDNGRIICVSNNVLLYDSVNEVFGVMGRLGGHKFSYIIKDMIDLKVVVPAELVTEEIINHLYEGRSRYRFKIKEETQ